MEMLAVLAIMGIMMAITVASIGGIGHGRKLAAAARQVGGKLNMARAYAVAKREYVAVLLPDTSINFTGNNTLKDEYSGKAKNRACIVRSDNTFKKWIDGNIWQEIPSGTFLSIDSGSLNITNLPDDLDSDSTCTVSCPAVVFKPSGAATQDSIRVRCFEGVYNKDSHLVRASSTEGGSVKGWYVDVNGFTGRISYEKE